MVSIGRIVAACIKWYNLLKSKIQRRRLAMDTSMSYGKPLVILNPAANRGKMYKHRAAARRRVEREQAEIGETTRQGEGKELAMIAAKEERSVITVGADGAV